MGEMIEVALPSELVDALCDKVGGANFASTDEAVAAAIRSMLDERDDDARLTAVRARIRLSLDDPKPSLDAGDARRHLDNLYALHRG